MSCPDITTLEQAEAQLPSSVLPISGLRRNDDGTLTDDAKQTIMDGLKSRSVDPTDSETKKKLIEDLGKLLCSTNKQYQYLLKVMVERMVSGNLKDEFVDVILRKNMFMLDILTISRHIATLTTYDGSVPFIEGWQNMSTSTNTTTATQIAVLARERDMLQSENLRKHMVEITGEKNNIASNYLAMYGFLNLVAMGLILYVAGSSSI
jgi:hypothetical protein